MTTPSIYRLVCTDGHFYIGSTRLSLPQRMAQHNHTSLRDDCRGNKVYSHIHKVGWDNVKIILVQKVPEGADHRKIEDAYIRASLADPLCLNKNRVCITDAERAELGLLHRKRVQERRNAPVVCECGHITTVGRLQQHTNSFRHRQLISEPQDRNEDELDYSDPESQQE